MRSVFIFPFVGLILSLGFPCRAEVIEHIVAIVNDEVVTQTDLESFKKRIETGGLVDDALIKITSPQELTKNRKALIDHMVDERILDSEVKKKNLSATIEQVEQEIRNITNQKNISRAQLKQALQENGVSFSDYQDFIRTSLERHSLIDKEIRSKIKISDEDLSAAFVAKKGGGTDKTSEYTISHILFRPQKGGDAAAKARAERIYKKVKAKEMPFERFVVNYSEDPSDSPDGLLGTFRSGEMAPEMSQAIEHLATGDVSAIVKTKAGYHIFKLVNKSMVSNPNFEKEKEALFAGLMNDAFKKQFRMWLDQKRRDTFVRINPG